MSKSITIRKLQRAIAKLPAGRPQHVPGRWYTTQKQHWLGWLREYHSPGAYGRRPDARHDAAFAYNHIVNPYMLLWLVKTSGVQRSAIESANRVARRAGTMMAKSAAIRRVAPWADVERALWGSKVPGRSSQTARPVRKAGACRVAAPKKALSVRALRQAIASLPSDRPRITPGKWYRTQQEHWLGWLRDYDGPGAYGRKSQEKRDARFAYNHIVEPRMLLWLILACGVAASRVKAAREAARRAPTMMQQSAAVRRLVPWDEVEARLMNTGQGARHLP
jgi:hypothetical protein